MTYVWFSLMIGVSSAWVVWFLARPLKNNTLDLQNSNIALGRQKKLELQNDLKQGLIDEELFAQAEDDITQILAQELSQSQNTVVANSPVPIWLVAILVVLIAVSSLVIYQSLSPKYSTAKPVDEQIMSLSLEQSAVKLQEYLQQQSDDANAWQMLGLTYFELGQLDESLQAYEQAYRLNPKNPRLLVEYASSIAIKNDDDFSGRAIELVKQALELEPNAPDALYMAGLYAVSQQDFKLAQLLWRKSFASLAPNSPDRDVIADALTELSVLLGGNTELGVKDLQPSSEIRVNVSFSKQILASRTGEDYLMVYAKAVRARPMPIAIVKIKLKDFSGQVTLDDNNSIVPNNTLSQAGDVLIVARLSKTGAAFLQADDVQTTSEVVRVKDSPVINLKIE